MTLPGIAVIVLTIGTAVDSNVLIYERVREEVRAGRSIPSALQAGFRPRLPPPSWIPTPPWRSPR